MDYIYCFAPKRLGRWEVNQEVRYIYDPKTGKGRYKAVGRFELIIGRHWTQLVQSMIRIVRHVESALEPILGVIDWFVRY